ncbi:helix-turn-helix transcriptional regulator [Pelagibius sp.]|uniref:helix-turn-helix transcriptional regulator n=1 Tax=Pelagibius sp. TaxID=1931238 RepID=UPI003B514936
MRTQRLFLLLDILRSSRRPISAAALAGRLGVSQRTAYRDLSALAQMGAPVRGEPGLGYQLERGYFLPPIRLEREEFESLVMAVKLLAARGDQRLAQAAQAALGKIRAVTAEDGEGAAERSYHAHSSASALAGGRPFLGPLRQAIRHRNKVALGYCDLDDRPSRRTVRALGLTAFDTVWLFTGWCELRQDFRNFRLDRIVSARALPGRFPPEQGKELTDYLRTL